MKKMKNKRRLRSMPVITWLLILSIMGTWLVSVGCLTVVTAQEIYDAMYEKGQDYADSVSHYGLLHEFYDDRYNRSGYQYERPDFLENQMLSTTGRNTSASYDTGGNYVSFDYSTGQRKQKLIRDIWYPMETAVLFYNPDGNLLHSSESDIMYFDYYTQEEWDAGMDTTSGLHYGWIDISEGKDVGYPEDPYLRFRVAYAGVHTLWTQYPLLRVTGYFEGTELKPVIMHYATNAQIYEVVESTEQFSTGPDSYSYITSDVDRTGKLDWQLQFDRSSEYEDKELVTVYIEYPEMWDYEGKSLMYDGQEYETLAALTETLDLPRKSVNEYYASGIFRLSELLVFTRWIGETYDQDYLQNGQSTVDFIMVTALRGSPLGCAVSALRNIYIVTGLLALVVFLLVRGSIKKHLVQPIADIADAMEDGWRNIYHPENTPTMWLEADKLHAGFVSEQDQRRMRKNEVARLNTALEYAKTAEENRRQMVSHIAHEFKTPLAVIHSYAEGLNEHIAEGKREKYVEVILSESERLDAMVLELLDLSRLEAGKVKLARDEFDLCALARSVFERLERAAADKELKVELDFPETCEVTADEGRLRQVIENFASNAVKYTPAGGGIKARISVTPRSGITFAVENDSEPFSQEALSKVWDTFYRTDSARTGPGTGLGLAIAKNIVELHGGKCAVCNTKTGVEFRFTL